MGEDVLDPVWGYEHDNLIFTQEAMEKHIAFLCANEFFATGSFTVDWKGGVSRRQDKTANLAERAEFRALVQSPYVGRMDFEVVKEDGCENVVTYIGERSVYLEDKFFVYDWRTPVGQRFYIKNDLSFEHNDYNYTLMLRRAILIDNAKLDGYDTEYQNTNYTGEGAPSTFTEIGMEIAQNVVTEPFLIRILKERRERHELSPIIISMQEEQNNINREAIEKNIIVQGCAGSGKTMILLHRLSFLKYNNPGLNWDRVKILTPNELFNVHINQLSERLELGQIERITVERYYANLLMAYEEYKLSAMEMPLKDKNTIRRKKEAELTKLAHVVKSESGTDEKLVNYVYSDNFSRDFDAAYTLWWRKFEETVDYAGIDVINERYRYNQKVEHESGTYKKISIYLQITAAIKSAYMANEQKKTERYMRIGVFDEKIDREARLMSAAQNRADEMSSEALKKATEIAQRELLAAFNPRTDNLEYHLRLLGAKDNSLSGSFRAIVAMRDEVRLAQMRKMEYESGKNELLMEIQGYDDIGLSADELVRINRAQSALREFDMDKLYDEVYGMLCAPFGAVKKKPMAYRYQMYAKTYFYYMVFGKSRMPEQILCVDEAQDVSVNEYRLWSMVNSGVRFNLYGDINQRIKRGRGIENWDDLADVFDSERFSLTINYRNAAEISGYCNEKLGMSDIAVGISGERVRECSVDEIIDEVMAMDADNKRVALVYSPRSKTSLGALKRLLTSTNVDVGNIQQNRVAAITIEQAKGLEFETVYLLTDQMNDSERYIAYTRALNKLIVG